MIPLPSRWTPEEDVLGFFGPDSVSWRVHSDPTFSVGGLRALLLQALHPVAMDGVARFSGGFREEPWPRLIRTATYVDTLTFGTRTEAPPPTNSQLTRLPGVLKYTGLTKIVLSGTTMTVTNNGTTDTVGIPSSGVVYVANGSCSGAYANNNPFTQTYPTTPSGCGTVQVSAPSGYSGQLTIAAENDIIIDGNIVRSGADGLLGLIANNFVRVKHPICPSGNAGCTNGTVTAQTAKGSCNGGVNGTGTLNNVRIPKPGGYAFTIDFEGEEIARTRFEVAFPRGSIRPGKPDDPTLLLRAIPIARIPMIGPCAVDAFCRYAFHPKPATRSGVASRHRATSLTACRYPRAVNAVSASGGVGS